MKKFGFGFSVVLAFLFGGPWPALAKPTGKGPSSTVYVLPIRADIMPPLVYLVRRGVKEAMEAHADLLILDMDTNGGRVDTTEEIIDILNHFKGQTVTYVNRRAFSAGTFISVATQKIYMAPQSVIGAAAPIMLIPGGGPAEMPPTVEAKMTSAVAALVRANAEKNGYNLDVVEAMIDKNKALKIDGEVLNEKGEILTLTSSQAARRYGDPPKPLLSSGTVDTLDDLIDELGYAQARVVRVQPTGVERFGAWLNKLSPLLLLIGAVGLYIEFKTPGFGVPGIVGLSAFALYFLGGYVAGLSGMEWIAIFVLGLVLLGLELFVFPGVGVLGLAGLALIFASIVMAMVDVYPSAPGLPFSWQIRLRLQPMLLNLSVMILGSIFSAWLLSFILPKTSLYHALVSSTVSGDSSVQVEEARQAKRLGEVGVAVSVLRPGGKAQFGEKVLDVISQGEMIPRGTRVRIIGHSGSEAVVESAAPPSGEDQARLGHPSPVQG